MLSKLNHDSYNVYMRVLIIFNHPAPYKVHAFNELAKYVDLTVLFERTKAKDRPDSFYSANKYEFKHMFLKDHYFGNEGTTSNNVRKYIKEHHEEFDVILMNGYSHLAEIKAINYMHKHHIKFGLLINGGLAKTNEFFLKRKYKTSLIKKASYYLSTTKSSTEYLKYYGAMEENIHSYYYSNFFNNEISKASPKQKEELREKYNLPKDKKIFINPCQFIDRKNNLFLLSLFKDCKDILVLVGSGPLQHKYLEYIKANKMNNVIILPYQPKEVINELYKASDVHITLSKYDIFGHTVLEAFSNGVPVISSNKVISGLDYIKDGYNGYVVDLENPAKIKEMLEKINYSLSENAIKSAKENTFENSAKSIYEKLKEIYE